jgi:hypothetical protein
VTQTSGYWTTSGAPSGHQVVSYTQAIAAKANAILAACFNFEGVAPGYLNALVGSVPAANTARIGTGGAVVDGQWYKNDAAVDVNIPSAVGGGNTRIDRVVLRVTWASFQCVITRIAGTDAASPVVPSITQTPGTTYDIMLYQALVNTSGTVTLTDERVMAAPTVNRQGGSATDWTITGSNNYSTIKTRIQIGCCQTSVVGAIAVTFPVAFAQPPLVICTAIDSTLAYVGTPSATQVSIYSDPSKTVMWMAIGPIA